MNKKSETSIFVGSRQTTELRCRPGRLRRWLNIRTCEVRGVVSGITKVEFFKRGGKSINEEFANFPGGYEGRLDPQDATLIQCMPESHSVVVEHVTDDERCEHLRLAKTSDEAGAPVRTVNRKANAQHVTAPANVADDMRVLLLESKKGGFHAGAVGCHLSNESAVIFLQ